jgi:hypothetical protein
MSMRVAWFAVSIALMPACAARPLALPPPDLPPAQDLASGDLGCAAPVPTSDGMCELMLQGADLEKSMPDCVLIESVSTGTATLVFPCAGGNASATFVSDVFTGSVQGTLVSLSLVKNFPWSDGCEWQTAQQIMGDRCAGPLHFTYMEGPLPGQTGCESSCTGTADVLVTP